MLLGHYLRGLEYRMELMELLYLPINAEDDASSGEQVAWKVLIWTASICI